MNLVKSLLACLVLGLIGTSVNATDYKLSALPIPPGSVHSGAASINDNGQIAGWFYRSGFRQACTWTDSRSVRELAGGAEVMSEATAINNRGQIVGDCDFYPRGQHAVIWEPDGSVTDIGSLFKYCHSSALGINEAGQVVGWRQLWMPNYDQWAFVWNPDGTVIKLAPLAGEVKNEAFAINNAGEVAGRSWDKDWNPHGFYWSKKTGVIDMGTLGGNRCWPCAMDDEGRVIGWSEDAEGVSRPFEWTLARGMIISSLPVANCMNEEGQVAGTNAQGVFLYTPDKGLLSIDVTEAYYRAIGVTDINASGLVAGDCFYTDSDYNRAVVWVPNSRNYKPAGKK